MIGNSERGAAAKAALDVFGAKMFGDPESENLETLVGDLIADLGHLVDEQGEDFDAVVSKALRMWAAEKREDALAFSTFRVRFESTAAVSVTIEVEAKDEDDAQSVAGKLVSLSKCEEAAVNLCDPSEHAIKGYAQANGLPIVEVCCSLDENGFEFVEAEKMERA